MAQNPEENLEATHYLESEILVGVVLLRLCMNAEKTNCLPAIEDICMHIGRPSLAILPFILLSLLISQPITAQNAFTEEGPTRGISYIVNGGIAFGYGLALSDLDGDDDPDLILTGEISTGAVGFYENDGNGFFTDRSSTAEILPNEWYSGVVTADYDGDGDIDVFISGWRVPNVLLRNDGNFVFTDVTTSAGLGDVGAAVGCSFGDINGDGWLDLYLSNRSNDSIPPLPNRLYLNDTMGGFIDVTASHDSIDDLNLSFQSVLFDYDRDGDMDLYVSNDKGIVQPGVSNRLWRNDAGYLTEVSSGSGADVEIYSMGVGVGDFNGDGWIDLYPTNEPFGNPLLLNMGNDTFIDGTSQAGVAANRSSWGALFFDYDNNGHTDLYVATVFAANQLFANDGTLPTTEIGLSINADANPTGVSYCLAHGDLDMDGDLDLVASNAGENIHILINHEGEQRNWLKIKLVGNNANTKAVGATVDVETATGTQTRSVISGLSYKAAVPEILHFGLDNLSHSPEVTILWPGGMTTQLTNVAANQILTVIQPDDCNQNGIADDYEIAQGLIADSNSNLIPDSCEGQNFIRGDCNSDGSVNLADAVCSLLYNFLNGPASCIDSLDIDDSGSVNLTDPVMHLAYIFSSGASPVAPFPNCGQDPSPADGGNPLGCNASSCP